MRGLKSTRYPCPSPDIHVGLPVPGHGARGKRTVLRVIGLRALPNGFLNLGPQPLALQLLPQRLQRRADDAGF